MKRLFLAIIVLITLSSTALAGVKYYAVKVTDHEKVVNYRMCTGEDLKALMKEASAEKKYWSKATTLAQKDWKKKEEYKGKTFPRGCGTAMKISPGRAYTTQEDAQDKVAKYEASAIKKQEKNAAAAKKIKAGDKAAARKAASAAERDARYANALSMLEGHLSTLMTPAAAKE